MVERWGPEPDNAPSVPSQQSAVAKDLIVTKNALQQERGARRLAEQEVGHLKARGAVGDRVGELGDRLTLETGKLHLGINSLEGTFTSLGDTLSGRLEKSATSIGGQVTAEADRVAASMHAGVDRSTTAIQETVTRESKQVTATLEHQFFEKLNRSTAITNKAVLQAHRESMQQSSVTRKEAAKDFVTLHEQATKSGFANKASAVAIQNRMAANHEAAMSQQHGIAEGLDQLKSDIGVQRTTATTHHKDFVGQFDQLRDDITTHKNATVTHHDQVITGFDALHDRLESCSEIAGTRHEDVVGRVDQLQDNIRKQENATATHHNQVVTGFDALHNRFELRNEIADMRHDEMMGEIGTIRKCMNTDKSGQEELVMIDTKIGTVGNTLYRVEDRMNRNANNIKKLKQNLRSRDEQQQMDDRHRIEVDRLKEEIKILAGKSFAMEKEYHRIRSERDQARDTVEGLGAQLTHIEALYDHLIAQHHEHLKSSSDLQDTIANLGASIRDRKTTDDALKRVNQNIAGLKNDVRGIDGKLTDMDTGIKDVAGDIKVTKQKLIDVDTGVKDTNRGLGDLKTDVHSVGEKVNGVNKEVKSMVAHNQAIVNKMTTVEGSVKSIGKEVGSLGEKCDSTLLGIDKVSGELSTGFTDTSTGIRGLQDMSTKTAANVHELGNELSKRLSTGFKDTSTGIHGLHEISTKTAANVHEMGNELSTATDTIRLLHSQTHEDIGQIKMTLDQLMSYGAKSAEDRQRMHTDMMLQFQKVHQDLGDSNKNLSQTVATQAHVLQAATATNQELIWMETLNSETMKAQSQTIKTGNATLAQGVKRVHSLLDENRDMRNTAHRQDLTNELQKRDIEALNHRTVGLENEKNNLQRALDTAQQENAD